MMTTENVSLKRMRLYKTAYSPKHEKHVGIVHVCTDDQGLYLIYARLGSLKGPVLIFRSWELERFVL